MSRHADSEAAKRCTWIGVLTLVTVATTMAAACGTPFVALGTLGALYLPRRDAFVLVGINWIANQAIGFAWLHYPHTGECDLGGAAIGVASLVGCYAAMFVRARLRGAGMKIEIAGAFLAAFVAYEAILFVLSPASSTRYFALPIVVDVFAVNALALIGLLLVKITAAALGLSPPLGGRPSADPGVVDAAV